MSKIWTRNPEYPVVIRGDTQFTSFLYPVGDKLFDACNSPLRSGVNTSILRSNAQVGSAFEFNGTSSGVNFGDVSTVDFAGAYSIFILFRPDGIANNKQEMLLGKDAASNRQFVVELNPRSNSGSGYGQTGSIGHIRFVSGGGYYQKYSAANVVSDGKWYSLLIGSTNGSTDIVAFLNGSEIYLNPGDSSTTGLMAATTTELTLGRRLYSGYFGYFKGGIAATATANTAPTEKLAQALYQNPWQFLQPSSNDDFLGFSGGSLPTIIALSASTLTFVPKAVQPGLAARLSASTLTFVPKAVQPGLAARLAAAILAFVPKAPQLSVTARLAAGALTFVAKAITYGNASLGTVIDLGAASLSFVAKATQSALRNNLSAASLTLSGMPIQNKYVQNLANALLKFTAQPTNNMIALSLGVASLRFVARAISVTGSAVGAVKQFMTLMGFGK